AEIAATPQKLPENKIEVKGDGLDITVGNDQGAVSIKAPVNGVGDFVAVVRYAGVSRRPSLRFRFHEQPQGEGIVVQLPASMRMDPPSEGARDSGVHACCNPFDAFVSPLTPGKPSIFTGPPLVLLPAPVEEEQTAVISVNGPTITVYGSGQ